MNRRNLFRSLLGMPLAAAAMEIEPVNAQADKADKAAMGKKLARVLLPDASKDLMNTVDKEIDAAHSDITLTIKLEVDDSAVRDWLEKNAAERRRLAHAAELTDCNAITPDALRSAVGLSQL